MYQVRINTDYLADFPDSRDLADLFVKHLNDVGDNPAKNIFALYKKRNKDYVSFPDERFFCKKLIGLVEKMSSLIIDIAYVNETEENGVMFEIIDDNGVSFNAYLSLEYILPDYDGGTMIFENVDEPNKRKSRIFMKDF